MPTTEVKIKQFEQLRNITDFILKINLITIKHVNQIYTYICVTNARLL